MTQKPRHDRARVNGHPASVTESVPVKKRCGVTPGLANLRAKATLRPMALTPSLMVPLGSPAPDFDLPNPATRTRVRLEDFKEAPALVVGFLCNHCPYVQYLRQGLAEFGRECAALGAAFVAINPNDPETHPADSPDLMPATARQADWTFPYLFDPTQEVSRAFGAACTPDFFVYGSDRRLIYRGEFDDSRPGNGKAITGSSLRAAVHAALAGQPAAATQRPSIGCGIKWRR